MPMSNLSNSPLASMDPPFQLTRSGERILISQDEFRSLYPHEGHHVEWKSGTSRKKIQEAIVAFSNASGGVIVIGVDDTGTLQGKPLDVNAEQTLWEIVQYVESPGPVRIGALAVESMELTIIEVERRDQGVAQTSNGQLLIRRGKQNLPLRGEELFDLMDRRRAHRYEERLSDWTLEQADSELLLELCQALGITTQGESYPIIPPKGPVGSQVGTDQRMSEALAGRSLARLERGRTVLTVVGALFLIPGAARSLGMCHIEAFRFPAVPLSVPHGDNDDNDDLYDLRVRLEGTPAQQIRAAHDWIVGQVGFDLVVEGVQAHEVERLPGDAVREIVANAVAHRDYQLSGSAIEVRLRPGNLEVTSPGTLPYPVTLDDLASQHSARNPALISVLRAFDLAEQAGRGVRSVRRWMALNLFDDPRWSDQPDGSVRVELPMTGPATPRERVWIYELESTFGTPLDEVDRRLLVETLHEGTLQSPAAARIAGCSRDSARASLEKLSETGLVERSGNGRGRNYRIATEALSRSLSPTSSLTESEMADRVLEMARRVPVSNAMVRESLDLPRHRALRLLAELVDAGRLIRVGAGRATRYKIGT